MTIYESLAKPMTGKEVLVVALKDRGYDGLVSVDAECGCELADLVPCGECCCGCTPAYRGPDPEGESKWMMYASKEAAEAAKQKIENAAAESWHSATPPNMETAKGATTE